MKITEMREDDIVFATELTRLEEWGYKEEDLKRLINFEPEGYFIAWENGKMIGIVTTTSYEDYAFLGCMIVLKDERGRGIGTKLMEHAISYLNRKGINTIELDGVFPAVTMYRRLGFKDKCLSLRFLRCVKGYKSDLKYKGYEYNNIIPGEIIDFDQKKTGLKRRRILLRLLEEFKDSVYISDSDKIKGYSVLRECSIGNFTPGPIIAENNIVAKRLLSRIISEYEERDLTIGVPEINSFMIEILLDYGFVYNKPSVRMNMGDRID